MAKQKREKPGPKGKPDKDRMVQIWYSIRKKHKKAAYAEGLQVMAKYK